MSSYFAEHYAESGASARRRARGWSLLGGLYLIGAIVTLDAPWAALFFVALTLVCWAVLVPRNRNQARAYEIMAQREANTGPQHPFYR